MLIIFHFGSTFGTVGYGLWHKYVVCRNESWATRVNLATRGRKRQMSSTYDSVKRMSHLEAIQLRSCAAIDARSLRTLLCPLSDHVSEQDLYARRCLRKRVLYLHWQWTIIHTSNDLVLCSCHRLYIFLLMCAHLHPSISCVFTQHIQTIGLTLHTIRDHQKPCHPTECSYYFK